MKILFVYSGNPGGSYLIVQNQGNSLVDAGTNIVYYAIKGNEALTHATTWVNLESIRLNERSQTQKTPYCMISFI